MAIPGEDFVLRLSETVLHSRRVNVLDLVTAPVGEPTALVDWEYGTADVFDRAGLALFRFKPDGTVKFQNTRIFCGPDPGEDCGKWVLVHGAITNAPEAGFVAVGTIVHVDTLEPRMIAMGIGDDLRIAWLRNLTTSLGNQGRAIGIVPLAAPQQYLVAARNPSETDTWLFRMDGDGFTSGIAIVIKDTWVQRLRATPSAGIFVLGQNNSDPSNPRGWILNIDPATVAPVWERIYDPGDGSTLRWFDIAQGNVSLVAVGNIMASGVDNAAIIAGLDALTPNIGAVRWVWKPQLDDGRRIRVHGVANHQTLMGPADQSSFSICGDIADATWHLNITEEPMLQWQKTYNRFGSTGTLDVVMWPSDEVIVVGGRTTVVGNPPRGVVISSHATPGTAPWHCSEETGATFPTTQLTDRPWTSPATPFTVIPNEWPDDTAPNLEVLRGCLDEPV